MVPPLPETPLPEHVLFVIAHLDLAGVDDLLHIDAAEVLEQHIQVGAGQAERGDGRALGPGVVRRAVEASLNHAVAAAVLCALGNGVWGLRRVICWEGAVGRARKQMLPSCAAI